MDNAELNIRNTIIERCGMRYIAHYRRAKIKVYGDCWGITIPIDRLDEFINIFPEMNWEDGLFLEDLNGKYIRIVYDLSFNIIALRHIIKDIDYMVKKDED